MRKSNDILGYHRGPIKGRPRASRNLGVGVRGASDHGLEFSIRRDAGGFRRAWAG